MNIQLQRKQIIILGLAMSLAVASYWIPIPQRHLPPLAQPELSEPANISTINDSIAFIREPATAQRFPVAEQVVQSLPSRSGLIAKASEPVSVRSLSRKQFIEPQELGNGDTARLGNVLLVPVKNLDLPQKR
ncbi:MAG: hypothetical protein IPP10_11240 [Candidatus Competibacteraceae bacterium]|nr:hypothetical protein [Candidatus Competibacteraceae bacterium]MBK7982386.1 hypothetical protein [Candidatus Competibacteraceae bacterium]MBK8899062.1 hypothetical protein [Candidatus Competibacteraceae bacterium]MBK8963104.1 hypothetical protein [Candidatus Competibacteraceae bacterium]MBK9952067.1 hypothetical protein [Candidatus Competibacteraceae bacterium]